MNSFLATSLLFIAEVGATAKMCTHVADLRRPLQLPRKGSANCSVLFLIDVLAYPFVRSAQSDHACAIVFTRSGCFSAQVAQLRAVGFEIVQLPIHRIAATHQFPVPVAYRLLVVMLPEQPFVCVALLPLEDRK